MGINKGLRLTEKKVPNITKSPTHLIKKTPFIEPKHIRVTRAHRNHVVLPPILSEGRELMFLTSRAALYHRLRALQRRLEDSAWFSEATRAPTQVKLHQDSASPANPCFHTALCQHSRRRQLAWVRPRRLSWLCTKWLNPDVI